MKRSIFGVSIIAIILAILWISRNFPQEKTESAIEMPVAGQPEADLSKTANQHIRDSERPQLPESQPPGTIERAKGGERSLNEMRKEIVDYLKDAEANRTSLLSEIQSDTAISYLVGIKTPSNEKIKEIRSMFAMAQKQVKGEQSAREELDQWITEMVRKYDPFAAGGKKVVVISVPHDPQGKLVGLSYLTDDFESEVAKFKSGKEFELTGKDVLVFGQNEAGDLERFQKIISK